MQTNTRVDGAHLYNYCSVIVIATEEQGLSSVTERSAHVME